MNDRDRLRKFAKTNGQLVSPLPYVFENALFFNFYALGDMNRLRKLCDKWFNKPSGFEFEVEPLVPYVVITFAYYPKAWSKQLSVKETGFLSYREMIFSVFVKRKRRPWELSTDVYGFIPFLLLDRARAIVAGREAFGLPKALGQVAFPSGENPDANYFNVSTVAPLKYGGMFSQAREEDVFRVKCPGFFKVQDYLEKDGPGMRALHEHAYSALNEESGISFDLSRKLLQVNQINSITLFQLRDPRSRNRALHQSILEYCTQNITLAIGGPLKYDFELEFPTETAFFPFQRELGLGIPVSMAFWFRMNFEFNLAGELWNANDRRGPGFPF